MNPCIVPIVEGHGEVTAVPVLLRRILERMGVFDIHVAKPLLAKRNQIVREHALERKITQACRKRENAQGILLLLDTDPDYCPVGVAAQLRQRAEKATHLPVVVVLAHLEFEAWFLAAKESLRGVRGIADDAVSPDNPESIRGAKGRLSDNMVGNRRYLPADDQAALADKMDLEVCLAKSRSFRKLWKDIESLVSAIKTGQ
ncbi:MAG: DUF4276 family protein [Thermodesulfobacteriota bacterium]